MELSQTRDTQVGIVSEPAETVPADAPLPHRIGRYVVLHELGAGAMGVVLLAYDRELDRKVAIKRVQPSHSNDRDSIARMRREGKALARVSHPNIVQVYEVGIDDGALYLAMEFIAGQTLKQWAGPDRSWREVLEVHLQAARGLAAAHRSGLVHRDYKPANVMIGEDGRVRVLDFGLVRRAEAAANDPEDGSEVTPPHQSATELTAFNAILGTPRYMPPEQFLGEPATARSDQFSFCVSLWEALAGERPFGGGSIAELSEQVTQGGIRPLPSGVDVPAPIVRALRRGLSPDPEERWADMDALIAALEPSLKRRRSSTLLTLGALGVVASLGAFAFFGADEDPCAGVESPVEAVWNSSAAGRVREGLMATGAPFASDAAKGAVQKFERYAASVTMARRDACEATSVRREQSESALDRRMACLDHRLESLAALSDSLANADLAAAEHALASVENLPSVDPCADVERLAHGVAPPAPALANEVAALRRELLVAETQLNLGKAVQAIPELEKLDARVAEVDYRPLHVEYAYTFGAILAKVDRYDEAYERLESAFHDAVALGHDELAVEASSSLAYVVGYGQGKLDEGLAWGRIADAEIEHAGTDMQRAALSDTLGILWVSKGDYKKALEYHRESLQLAEAEAHGEASREVAKALLGIGDASLKQGDFDAARESYRSALEIHHEVLGPAHPEVALTMSNLATVNLYEGRYGEANDLLLHALAIHRAAYGAANVHSASIEVDIGTVAAMQGDLDTAATRFRAGIDELREVLGPDHPRVTAAEINLASIHLARSDFEQARPLLENAHEVFTRQRGDDAPELIEILHNLALVDIGDENHAAAIDKGKRVIELRETASNRDHPDVLMALTAIGESHLALGELDAAYQSASEGLEIAEKLGDTIDPIYAAQLELVLAMTLEKQGREFPRALELAQAARAVLGTKGDLVAETLKENDALIERLEKRR